MPNKKRYPVVRTGRLAAGTSGEFEINIERFLSKTNRRLYRQARTYKCKLDLDSDSTEKFDIYVLADNWMNHRALKMAYDMYLQNSKDERDRLKGTAQARWQDFRTVSGGPGPFVSPVQYNVNQIAATLTAGEFGTTIVVDAAGNSKNFTWGGSTATRYGILEEYDKAGNANTSPTTSTGDMPYDDLMSDDNAAMAVALQTLGDVPPYDADGVLQASAWVKVAQLGAAGGNQRLSSGYFDAPCGFIVVQQLSGVQDASGDLTWTVQSGDYKGVHAPSMLE